jgi:predicted DNA-binding protein (MmcQ/YjbR family)
MNIEELREYCMSKTGVAECLPFDDVTLVFKVAGKMFLLTNLDGDFSINLKNTPEKVLEMKEEYAAVLPGHHMNKTYWVTVLVDGTIADSIIYRWVDESYREVACKLPKKVRSELNLEE